MIATGIATRALAALLLLETITLPPPETPEEVSLVWVGVTLSELNRQGQGKNSFSWTSTCAGFLKHNSGRNPQTGLQCMV